MSATAGAWPYALFLLLLPAVVVAATLAPIELASGVRITADVTVRPGVYGLSDHGDGMVTISGRGFTVDFQGARIVGPGLNTGIGLHIVHADHVTIRNAHVTGCLWGIVVEHSKGVRLIDCVSSRNGDLPPRTIIDESGREPEDQHGGGILLRDSDDCEVERCVAREQWDGIDVVRSHRNSIQHGDFSFNNNWGVHFWGSSHNIFRANRAIWCTTGAGTTYQALTGWSTLDAQAVAIDHNSNDNLIEGNDLRFGGDGIFIRANEGPLRPGGPAMPRLNPSCRNILRGNDCSFSPNNAIEVDFADDTVIEDNNCSCSNYGMWLGYSRRCIVRGNTCVNTSTHAIEIEQGLADVFEDNVFGWDMPRPDQALVYLRRVPTDGSPSGEYQIRNNLFYGAGHGVLLAGTSARIEGNTLLSEAGGEVVTADADSPVTGDGNVVRAYPAAGILDTPEPLVLQPVSTVTFRLRRHDAPATPPVVEVDGIPAWVVAADGEQVQFNMPGDYWDRPRPQRATIRLFDGVTDVSRGAIVAMPANGPVLTGISPSPANAGDAIVLTGHNLEGRVLLNGQTAQVLESAPDRLKLAPPRGVLTTARYNVIVERGEGDARLRSWPVTLAVDVPREQQPHLLSATFNPLDLNVGELLKVTFTLRNNLPIPARLMTDPAPPFTYAEHQGYDALGISEPAGTLHLRVTSDHPGDYNPGFWPWMFGFGRGELAPGETITVEGFIRVETPGDHVFRVGLVASRLAFIDDNAFLTTINVRP